MDFLSMIIQAVQTYTAPIAAIFQSPKHIADISKRLYAEPKSRSLEPSLTANSSEASELCPVHYLYDPVPKVPHYLHPRRHDEISHAARANTILEQNSVRLKVGTAGQPYRSSLRFVRASKYWKTNLKETTHVLQLLAADESALDIEVGNGITLARLARKELRSGIEDRITLATTYMFPGASEHDARIIACFMILYFVFDGKHNDSTPDKIMLPFAEIFQDKVEETPQSAVST